MSARRVSVEINAMSNVPLLKMATFAMVMASALLTAVKPHVSAPVASLATVANTIALAVPRAMARSPAVDMGPALLKGTKLSVLARLVSLAMAVACPALKRMVSLVVAKVLVPLKMARLSVSANRVSRVRPASTSAQAAQPTLHALERESVFLSETRRVKVSKPNVCVRRVQEAAHARRTVQVMTQAFAVVRVTVLLHPRAK